MTYYLVVGAFILPLVVGIAVTVVAVGGLILRCLFYKEDY